MSRKGVDHTARFPDLAKAIASLPGGTLIVDGEVAVFDERLVSRFDLLSEPDAEVPTTPPVYIAFDVLYARGRDLRACPLEARRETLERLLVRADSVFAVRRLASDGHAAWNEVLERGIEGYVSKDPTSTYLAGGPTRALAQGEGAPGGSFCGRWRGRTERGLESAPCEPARRRDQSCPNRYWTGALPGCWMKSCARTVVPKRRHDADAKAR